MARGLLGVLFSAVSIRVGPWVVSPSEWGPWASAAPCLHLAPPRWETPVRLRRPVDRECRRMAGPAQQEQERILPSTPNGCAGLDLLGETHPCEEASALLSPPLRMLVSFFFKILFIHQRRREREREAETQAEGKAGSLQGT